METLGGGFGDDLDEAADAGLPGPVAQVRAILEEARVGLAICSDCVTAPAIRVLRIEDGQAALAVVCRCGPSVIMMALDETVIALGEDGADEAPARPGDASVALVSPDDADTRSEAPPITAADQADLHGFLAGCSDLRAVLAHVGGTPEELDRLDQIDQIDR